MAATGALAVDMESAPLARGLTARPSGSSGPSGPGSAPPAVAVVRVVADTATAPLASMATLRTGVAALRTLRRIGPALAAWGRLAARRTVVLAAPRSFCAGVDRAIDIVERALERYPAPIYVRRQIVHNEHVVADLERRGVVFVRELDEVPDGATVIFSAHGVGPAVRAEAEEREMTVVDATCPLVAKVHTEARRFLARGDTVLLVGHAGHDEVEGTLGEAPGQIRLVETIEQARSLPLAPDTRASVLTQTTLAVDEASAITDALRDRLPLLEHSAIGRHLLRDHQPPGGGARDRGRVRPGPRRRLADLVQLPAPGRGGRAGGDAGGPHRRRRGAAAPPARRRDADRRDRRRVRPARPRRRGRRRAGAASAALDVVERSVADENLTFTVPKEVGGPHAHASCASRCGSAATS